MLFRSKDLYSAFKEGGKIFLGYGPAVPPRNGFTCQPNPKPRTVHPKTGLAGRSAPAPGTAAAANQGTLNHVNSESMADPGAAEAIPARTATPRSAETTALPSATAGEPSPAAIQQPPTRPQS